MRSRKVGQPGLLGSYEEALSLLCSHFLETLLHDIPKNSCEGDYFILSFINAAAASRLDGRSQIHGGISIKNKSIFVHSIVVDVF